jgi:lipopolysaccharide/colanic/teichoic acid biosynthesis glycosyltransferase
MRRSARVLILVGTLGAVFGLAKVHALTHIYDITDSGRLGWSIAYIGVLLIAAYAVGLPSLPASRNKLLVSAGGAALGATLMSVVTLIAGGQLLPRFVILGAAAIVTPWYLLCASVAEGGRQRAEARDRVVVVGDSDEGALVRTELEANPERPAVVVGAFDTTSMIGAGRGLPLMRATEDAQCSVIVLSRRASEQESIVDQAAALHRRGVRIRTLVGFYVDWLGKLPIGELERASMLFDIGEIHGRRYGRVKRLFDIAFGLAGVVALALAIPFVLVANLAGNTGPLFFRQARVGRDGRVFTMWKFRTMTAGDSTQWTSEHDERVTSFGRVLRRSHLDELPQALNILRGDLSIVGPRPEQPRYVEELTDKIPFYDLRHVVRPGLTGWAQVKFGYAGDERDALEKLQYDFFYLQRQTLGLDVRIIARTVRDVFGGGGR